MPKWAIVLVVAPLVLCLGCAGFGYLVVWPKVTNALSESEQAVTDEMAGALSRSVANRIPASGRIRNNQLLLRPADLNVNNVSGAAASGEVGFETGAFGTWVYGVETRINSSGITLVLPGVTYSGVPVVEEGRVEMTEIEAGDELLGFLFSDEMFEEALEEGINGALRDRGWKPVSITLRQGSMTILVEPDCAARIGGCSAATPGSVLGLR